MSGRRRVALLVLLVGLLTGCALAWLTGGPSSAGNWLTAFMAPMHEPIRGDPALNDAALRFDNVTLRQFAPLALPGQRVRLRISNEFGDAPLRVGGLHIAWRERTTGPAIRAGSDREVFFKGERTVDIAPGVVVYSDSVGLPDGERADLAISIYLPAPTPRASWHLVGSRSSFRSTPGNHLSSADFPVSSVDRGVYFLASIEIDAPRDAALWIAFGDSITDGAWHTVDTDGSWPARWAALWHGQDLRGPIGILNAGIGGNRLLSERTGPSGLARFRRDVLDIKGVRGVVLMIGINDLGGRGPGEDLPTLVTRLIAAQTDLAGQARASGLKVVGATLTPVYGSYYGVAEVEAARQQVNRWIRSSSVFDLVVDFDATLRDPQQPNRIRPDWTSDHVHPNDAGYRAMADTVVRELERAGLSSR